MKRGGTENKRIKERREREQGRANRGGNECMTGLRMRSGWKAAAQSKQATAACQTFDRGLMKEAHKSHGDILEAVSPKQAS